MKKHILYLCVAGLMVMAAGSDVRSAGTVTVHMFASAICPACARAKQFLNEYAPKNNITVIYYEVLNKDGQVDVTNLNNRKKLVAMLSSIDERLAKKPFIYDNTMKAYPFIAEKGVPYYEKRISQTTVLKKSMPVPVFIIGDAAVTGYQKNLLIRLINKEKNE